jgi:hypothetical protein
VTRKAPSRPVIPIRPTAGEVANAGDADDGVHFVSMYQKQPDIYPRAVKGWFATWRWTFVWLTQLLFYGSPGCCGTVARRCSSTWRRSASTSWAWCCTRRT